MSWVASAHSSGAIAEVLGSLDRERPKLAPRRLIGAPRVSAAATLPRLGPCGGGSSSFEEFAHAFVAVRRCRGRRVPEVDRGLTRRAGCRVEQSAQPLAALNRRVAVGRSHRLFSWRE